LNGISPGLGDVVAFIHKGTGMPFIHRVIGKKGNTYLLKGDNATETDGLISESDILGCVRMVERRGLRVFFGLGPERFLIAYLNRRGILLSLIYPIVAKTFSKIFFVSFNSDGSRTSPLVTFAPPP